MSRYKRYLDIDVLTAAKQRIHRIFDIHDSVVVCFSGGKDSLALLHLVREVAEERGELPVQAIFRDEELIPDEVISFVAEHMDMPWLALRWYCVPIYSTQFVLGKMRTYIQWDPNRRHLRPMPPWAIQLPAGDTRVFDVNSTDAFTAAPYPGKVALVTGVRASESLIRYRASVNKLVDNYINAGPSPRISLCKPLFDWNENDILRLFYERDIRFCSIYTAQHLAGGKLRVSTPLHAEAAKVIGLLRQTSPTFYNQLLALFPDVAIQDRYWGDLDRDALADRYGETYEGVREFILEMDDEKRREALLGRFEGAMIRARKDPGGYPPAYVLRWAAGGGVRELMAIPASGRAAYAESEVRRAARRKKEAQ